MNVQLYTEKPLTTQTIAFEHLNAPRKSLGARRTTIQLISIPTEAARQVNFNKLETGQQSWQKRMKKWQFAR